MKALCSVLKKCARNATVKGRVQSVTELKKVWQKAKSDKASSSSQSCSPDKLRDCDAAPLADGLAEDEQEEDELARDEELDPPGDVMPVSEAPDESEDGLARSEELDLHVTQLSEAPDDASSEGGACLLLKAIMTEQKNVFGSLSASVALYHGVPYPKFGDAMMASRSKSSLAVPVSRSGPLQCNLVSEEPRKLVSKKPGRSKASRKSEKSEVQKRKEPTAEIPEDNAREGSTRDSYRLATTMVNSKLVGPERPAKLRSVNKMFGLKSLRSKLESPGCPHYIVKQDFGLRGLRFL